MYAVIETGGKQYRVQEGDILSVEKLGIEAGETVEFDRVLVLSTDDFKVGKPYIEGAKVVGEVVENGKADKIVIFKYKKKKDYRRKQGHRQPYSLIKITSLEGKKKSTKPDAEKVISEPAAKSVSSSMKKDQLIAYAKEHNIKIDEKSTKAEIIDTIKKAEA